MDGIEAAYGRGALGNLTNRSRRSNGTAGSPMSLTLDPFVWETGYEQRGGGAWVLRSTPPPLDLDGLGVYEVNGDSSSPAISPRGGSSSDVKNIMLLAKDKEALLEEAIRLKRALHEKKFFLRKGRVHASTIEIENRKLEFDIKDMEMQGPSLDSARTPRGSSIRLKLKGLKIRYEDMRSACDAQHEEIATLRRDVRVTTTQEMEMERDALLQEITRMQKDVRGLKAVQNALKCEHQDLCLIKRRADELEIVNYELESRMGSVNKDLEKSSQDVVTFRQKMVESSIEARKNAKRFKELEEHTLGLRRLLAEQKAERLGLDKELKCLDLQLKKAEKKLASKGLRSTSPKQKKGKSETPRSPRKDQAAMVESPKLKSGKTMGASAKGGAGAAAAAAAAAGAASFKSKNASGKLTGSPSRPASVGTFKKQTSTAVGTSRPVTPESFRKKTFREAESDESMSKKAQTFKKQTFKEGAGVGAVSKVTGRAQSPDAIQKQITKKTSRPSTPSTPESTTTTRSADSSRASSPKSAGGKDGKAGGVGGGGKSKDHKSADQKKPDSAPGGKRGAGAAAAAAAARDDAKKDKSGGKEKESAQAQKERQRLEKEMAAKMEKQQREMETAAKQREMEMAARLEKRQQEMEMIAKQREIEFAARQRELELLAKKRDEEAAAKHKQFEAAAAAAAAKQRELAAKSSKGGKAAAARAESRDEACQTSETAESYDELMRKMRQLESELASHRSRESSPGPSSPPPPSRALTKKLTVKTEMDRKLTKKATVKLPEVSTPRKSRLTPTQTTPPRSEPERKPEPPPKPELKKPESKKPPPDQPKQPVKTEPKPETETETEPERKYPARQMRRQILMADQDFAEDTKQITGPAEAPRPRSVMFESSSFNILLSDSNTDPLIETQTREEKH